MNGRSFQIVDWRDVGGAVGFTEDIDEESLLDYLHAVLLGDSKSNPLETCPAIPPTLAELPFAEPKNSKERKQAEALDKVLPALIRNAATVDELADELDISPKLVRIAVERLRSRRLLLEAESGLLFLTITKKERTPCH
jgi:hypothetical protein